MSPTPLTIVSNNVYQIAAFYVAYEKLQGDLFKIASCTQQTPRAIELGKFVKEYDVVLLQEMWGSCVHLVFDAIRSSHSVVERFLSFFLKNFLLIFHFSFPFIFVLYFLFFI